MEAQVLGHVLAVANLERLQEQLEDYDLMRAAALLEQGRPKLLQDLKKAGVSSLVDRQALCGAISKAVKAGELHAVASLTEDAAAQLVCAAARGDGAGVLSALQAGASATSCDGRGTTACMAAAEQGHVSIVRQLLELGATALDAQRQHDGANAVMLATKRSQHSCLAALLGARADANLTNHAQWSALMIACESDDVRSVGLLLDARASPTLGLHNGWSVVLTPLKLACIGGRAGCVERLLAARAGLDADDGSKLDIVEADGSTMLLYAAQRTHQRTPHAADGHVRTVRLLLRALADPNQARWDGISPLAYAACWGDAESAQLLLEARAAAHTADEAGWTALLWAALRGHTACVQLLCAHGASTNVTKPNGFSALHLAAQGGHEACVHSLLAASASVDAESVSEGHTPLMRAARYGRLGCVRMLLGARAATALVDAQGWTATEHATRWGHEACAAVLRAHGDALEQMEAIQLTKPIGLEQMETTLVAHDPESSRFPTEPSRFPTEPSRFPTEPSLFPTEPSRCPTEPPCSPAPLHPVPSSISYPSPPHYVQFGPLPRLSPSDSWQERPWQPRPAAPTGATAQLLATSPPRYYCSSTHPHFANVLQCILLEHGFERAMSLDVGCSLMWIAGQVSHAQLLCSLRVAPFTAALLPSQLLSQLLCSLHSCPALFTGEPRTAARAPAAPAHQQVPSCQLPDDQE